MTEEVPTKTIVNCETQEVTIVPLTEEELAIRAESAAAIAAAKAAEEQAAQELAAAKASAEAKLAALGLTPEEIAALR
jgi:hypothetical protein